MQFDRKKIGTYLYIIYFCLMIAARAIGMYEGQMLYNAILVIGMALFVLKIIVTNHTVTEYVIIASLMLISVIVYLHTGEKGLIVCFATMLGMKGIDKVSIIKSGSLIAGVCILFRVFTGVFGLAKEVYYPQDRAGIGMMFRHSLGYVHPNTLHMNVLMLSVMLVYVISVALTRHKKGGLSRLIIASVLVLGFNLYIFVYSGSRTGVLALFVYLMVNLWFYMRESCGMPEKTICFAAYPVVCLIAVVMPHVLPDKLFDMIDITVFNTRLSLAKYFWSNNHLSLWGIRLNNPDPLFKTYGIDMAQLYLFFQLGIVAFIIVSALTLGYVYFAVKKNLTAELAVLMGMLFAGIWEPFLYNLGFKNFSWVFFGAMLYSLTDVATEEKISGASGIADGGRECASVFDTITISRALIALLISAVIGGMVSGIYALTVSKPDALYADREEDESGTKLGLTPEYLTADDVLDLKSADDIIIGYTDEHTPMYRYDTGIAVSEYHKKMLSLGVWSMMICMAVIIAYTIIRNESRPVQEKDNAV